ncbi:MAG: type II secretion system protein [bacterium]|nr:type II secretion system protein [bacterium]
MNRIHRNAGFTLFEVIIAVALVAIMAVAIAPPLIKNLNEGKVSRAQSDSQVIANAILQFYKDTGSWPMQNDADAAVDLTRMATNASLGGGNAGIPVGAAGVPGGGNWDSWGVSSTVTDQLIRNATDTVDPLYTESQSPHVRPGWNGPYLDSAPLDPWGNAFVVNLRYMNNAVANYTRHAVIVLSAGPNEVFETTFQDATMEEQIGGDDVGYVLRPAEQQ